MSEPEPASVAITTDMAMAMARKFELVREDGTVACIRGCKGADGIEPSWRCASCIGRDRALGPGGVEF